MFVANIEFYISSKLLLIIIVRNNFHIFLRYYRYPWPREYVTKL